MHTWALLLLSLRPAPEGLCMQTAAPPTASNATTTPCRPSKATAASVRSNRCWGSWTASSWRTNLLTQPRGKPVVQVGMRQDRSLAGTYSAVC